MTAPINCPLYLAPPQIPDGYSHGRVTFGGGYYHVSADPDVLQMVKRLFPGSRGRKSNGSVSFPATRRAVGDLNWLLLRYPMEIDCQEQFDSDRQRAVEHANRREDNQCVAPIQHPAKGNTE